MEQRSPGRGERGPGGKKPPRGSPITYSVARAKRLVHVFVDAYCVLVLSLLVYRFVSVMNPSALGFVSMSTHRGGCLLSPRLQH